jgi:hypothetical protein
MRATAEVGIAGEIETRGEREKLRLSGECCGRFVMFRLNQRGMAFAVDVV